MTTTKQATADAWHAYHAAFQEFAEKVRRVQQLTEQIEQDSVQHTTDVLEQAVYELERARLTYNRARNDLAEAIGAQKALASDSRPADIAPSSDRVRTIANLLWEASGRPEGTADTDWLRAERIINHAQEQDRELEAEVVAA